MDANGEIAALVKLVAVISVLGLLGVLVYFLLQLGFSRSRVVLFALLGTSAVIGGVGVVQSRFTLAMVGIVGLSLIGFWQAVLSIFIAPVIVLLLLAAFLDRRDATRVATS